MSIDLRKAHRRNENAAAYGCHKGEKFVVSDHKKAGYTCINLFFARKGETIRQAALMNI